MEPFATSDEFLARFDAKYVAQLAGTVTGGAPNVPRITAALIDATAELAGYEPRVPASHWPGPETRRLHCIKVATYLLTLDRPGKEFESIRNAYTDTIAFYTNIISGAAGAAAEPSEGSADAPDAAFTDDTLEGFV